VVNTGETTWVPELVVLDVHHAEQDEVLEDVQVMADDWPEVMVEGEGVTVTDGAELGAPG
jgi:DNA-directed RNA polymerase subunit H (RpoH/RPB5)